MIDLGSEKWAQSVELPGATALDTVMTQNILNKIAECIARDNTSVGEDFPSSEAEMQTRKRLPLLYTILGRGVFLDYLTVVSRFSETLVQDGLESAVAKDDCVKELFPLNWGSFTSAFPATCIVHGTENREVSCGESERLMAKLRENGLKEEYFPVQGADHVFDLELQEDLEDGHDELKATLAPAGSTGVEGDPR